MFPNPEWILERAESYRILAQFFLNPPDEEALDAIRQDFSLDSTESLEQIAEDFVHLFSSPQGILQPIESLYATDMTIAHADVSESYASAGLILDDSYETTPDHLFLEFLFMSYLIENNKKEMEKKFLEQHLMNWVPYYCDRIGSEAKTGFYKEIAEIVKDFLTAEYGEYENEDYGTSF